MHPWAVGFQAPPPSSSSSQVRLHVVALVWAPPYSVLKLSLPPSQLPGPHRPPLLEMAQCAARAWGMWGSGQQGRTPCCLLRGGVGAAGRWGSGDGGGHGHDESQGGQPAARWPGYRHAGVAPAT
eukprot:scaffold108011_cov16-Tisochrysis_lutea.AAC.1